MKISLITSTYNSAATVEDTLQSVSAQTHPDLEYIVVDGGSADGTLDLVKQCSAVSKLQSEPDNGIYDALNKGIALATGDVIGFLHSDDYFPSPHTLRTIAETFQTADVEAVYGDLDYVDRDDTSKVIRKWRSKRFQPDLFYQGWMPAHPTFYLKRSCYEKYGGYDATFRQSADYELMLRMLLKHGVSARYIPEVLVKMRVGGASNVSLANRWRANQEDARAWKKNGLKPGLFTRWKKPLSKVLQYLQ